MTRREKKSESLEIRLPYSQKQAFMAACKQKGVTASDTLRRLISDELTPEPAQPTGSRLALTVKRSPFKAAASFLGAALAVATFSTGASFAKDDVFERLDTDGDGVVTYEEFGGGLRTGSLAEIETKTQHEGGPADALPSYDPQNRDMMQELFGGMDEDGNGLLTVGELEGEGSFVRRSVHLDATGEERSTVITVELVEYDLSQEGRQSIAVTAESRSLEGEPEKEAVFAALSELETQVREGR